MSRSIAHARDDFYLSRHQAAALPARVDLRPLCSPVETQKQLSSCTANALAAAIEYLERRDGGHARRVSRLFVYYNARVMEHEAAKDDGVSVRDALRALRLHGACSEETWPYLSTKELVRPPPAAYEEAARHKLAEAFRVHVRADAMKACLADGHPVVFGLELYPGFDGGGDHGHVPTPAKGARCEGDHTMVAVGYDDARRAFVVRNSWGSWWGEGGYCFLGYDYVGDASRCYEAWTVTRMEAPASSSPEA